MESSLTKPSRAREEKETVLKSGSLRRITPTEEEKRILEEL